VEDNAVTATLMEGILPRHRNRVVLAWNGPEAVSLLGSHPDIQGVIIDIMMPEFSGLDLLSALRQNPAWRTLPTIVTTVRDDPETVAQAVALGCKEYILKPVRPARLIERVAKVFKQEKVILMSAPAMISRHSLSSEIYREIARNFSLQVDQAIALLRNWSTDHPGVGREDFTSIMESATLLGAERLMAVMEEVSPAVGSPQLTLHKCVRIPEELQQVRQVLCAQID
jgi:CheY-like chemotaxis protein